MKRKSWDEIDRSERKYHPDEEKESLVTASNVVRTLNTNLDSSINQFDMPSYDELSQAFSELPNDMTSLYLKIRLSN